MEWMKKTGLRLQEIAEGEVYMPASEVNAIGAQMIVRKEEAIQKEKEREDLR